MSKGPRLNNITRNFTARDSLGIEGVSNSISADICPIVNTVTPRPFYWAFITWCFYDFYGSCNPKERKIENVYKYIKQINYYFALASDITDTDGVNGFTGADSIKEKYDLNKSSFEYHEDYIAPLNRTAIGYYPAGLYSMGFLIDTNLETFDKYDYPHITPEGVKLAKAFDKIFSTTLFYKEYRKSIKKVPKEVLIELSKKINIDLTGFDEVKSILIDHLFNKEQQRNLIRSHNYLNFLYKEYKFESINNTDCRKILFDYFSERGNLKNRYPKELKDIIDAWEIVMGRQYFTSGLEMIWKFMLENLNTPKPYREWFNDCLNNSNITIDLNADLNSLIPLCNFDFEEREEIITNARSKNNSHERNIENGIKLILSIYNRLYDRKDFSKENKNYFNYGIDSNSIPFNEFFDLVEEYKEKKVEDFIKYIMYHYLLDQHMNTAFEKMLQGRDGYFVEKIDDEYSRKEYFDFDFQRVRMVQLYMVMQDLNVLGVE